MTDTEALLKRLRLARDNAAAIGDHAEALIMNDRIKDLKEGRCSPMVESTLQQFESALARKRAYGPASSN